MGAKPQINVRPSPKEYIAFEDWRVSQGMSESAALCDLVERFFDGGYKRSPEYRLNNLEAKLNELLGGTIDEKSAVKKST
ncbi:MAG: hypothetical protein ACREPR_14960 [Brasilonema sp.]